MRELGQALRASRADETIGAMVITGSEKAFAAGADIKAMKDWGYMDVYKADYITAEWETVDASASRSSPRSPVTRSAAAASWR